MTLRSLDSISLDSAFVQDLPADPSRVPTSRQVLGAAYSFVAPTPVKAPRLVAWSDEVGALLGIARPEHDSDLTVQTLAGNRILPNTQPWAACYGGHQFGNWAGQLGDGRAMSLTQMLAPDGKRYELQLKGAGPTPYSRFSDGRAVLRSSIREFLCSEAMHHLGVPTTRALCLVATGENVLRDMFYDGRARHEPGAIVTRVAESFVRFGNFEIFAAREEHEVLRKLADYVIEHHYPELARQDYAALFQEVCRRTALLITHFMRVGFVHGVLNTDNMSILGLSIDYGPYGFLDVYEPGFTPNTTDAAGRRYCYANQPGIGQWNLLQLARALLPLVAGPEPLEAGLEQYRLTFERSYRETMLGKLGLSDQDHDEDEWLIEELMTCLTLTEIDPTLFFRKLELLPLGESQRAEKSVLWSTLRRAFYTPDAIADDARTRLTHFLTRYTARAAHDALGMDARRALMQRHNPAILPRNYLVQEAIDAAEAGDFSQVTRLLEAFRTPYAERSDDDPLAQKRPEWARNAPGCSALSCSS